MAYIRATGVSVFINVLPDVLAERMQTHARLFPANSTERPLFRATDVALIDTLRQKHVDRLPIYQQADIIVSGEVNEQEILNRLGDWL